MKSNIANIISNRPRTEEEIETFKNEWASESIDNLKGKYRVAYNTLRTWAMEFKARRDKNTNKIIAESRLIKESIPENWKGANYEELLDLLKKYSKISQGIFPAKVIDASIETKLPIAVVFSSDWHLGHPGVDYNLFDKDMSDILNNKQVYIYLGGDSLENMIAIESAVGNQVDINIQYEFLNKVLEKLKNKVVAFGCGNHDLWTESKAKFDSIQTLARKFNLVYTRDGGLLNLKVGNITYRIFRQHQYRNNSALNLTHCVKAMLRQEEYDFQIGCIEHGHVPCVEEFYWKGEKRTAIKTGSYKILWDEYAQKKGFTGVKALNPTVILFPDKSEILSFIDMHLAFDVLRGLNGKR